MGLTLVLSIFLLCQTSVLLSVHGTRERPPKTSHIKAYCKTKAEGKCKQWRHGREELHQHIFEQAQKDMYELGKAFDDAKMSAMLFALRGNTACGKSSAIKNRIPEFKAAPVLTILNTKKFPTLNLDDYKTELEMTASRDFDIKGLSHDKIEVDDEKEKADAGDVFTDTDVHLESKTIKDLVMNWAKDAQLNGKPLSFILDGRLAGKSDHTEMYKLAKDTNRKLTVIDIDCPLDVSLERLLGRSHEKFDPIPGFKQVATEGFVQSRANRFNFVRLYTDTPDPDRRHLGKYVLITTNPQFVRKIALTIDEDGKKTGELPEFGSERPDAKASADVETRAKAEVEARRKEVIDAGVIAAVCNQRPADSKQACERRLAPWTGLTWSAAVDMHEDGQHPPGNGAPGK